MSTIHQKGEWRFPVENSFVRDSSISVEARLLFIILKGYVGPDCEMPFPSLATLARHMDRHRESIQKYLNELWENGYIERHHAKKDGKFTATRYTLFDRSGKKPLRKLPATEKAATKSTQFKDVPSEKEVFSEESVRVASESANADALSFSPSESIQEVEHPVMWEREKRDKKALLKLIPMPRGIPNEATFNARLEKEGIRKIIEDYRPDLYEKMIDSKWHVWKPQHRKWVRIHYWVDYVRGLADTIENAKVGF